MKTLYQIACRAVLCNRLAVILSALALSASRCAHAQGYSIADLGPGIGSGINNNAQAIGNIASDGTSPFLWTLGVMTYLPSALAASGINDNGEIVGNTGGTFEHAYLYSNGSVMDLGTLPGGIFSYAEAINDNGQIVGGSGTAAGGPDAFLYSGVPGNGGTMADMGTLGGFSSTAFAVNQSGQAAGFAYTDSGELPDAFLYSGIPGNGGMMANLGTLGGSSSTAFGMNDSGQVVGRSYTAANGGTSVYHAFLYTGVPGNGGTMTDLGTLGGIASIANAINDNGQVVGDYYPAAGVSFAFIYSRGVMTDLNTMVSPNSGWTLIGAEGINNIGQIVGYGKNPSGQQDAYVLTPESYLVVPQAFIFMRSRVVTISWPLNEFASYGLQTATNLFAKSWSAVTNPPVLNNGFVQVTVPAAGMGAFFRLKMNPVASVYVGNNLSVTNGGSDSQSPLVILGEYSPVSPLAASSATLSAGLVRDVKFYGQNYNFSLYALSHVTNGPGANEQTFRVVASQNFSSNLVSEVGIQTLAVTNFYVNAGDLLAFAGQGPYYPQNSNDATNSDATYEDSSNPDSFTATPPNGSGSQFTVGINGDTNATYEYISDVFMNQGRTYGIGVDILPGGQ